jgi:hypothetical protein
MKTFAEYINESTINEEIAIDERDPIKQEIAQLWTKISNGGMSEISYAGIGAKKETVFVKIYLASSKDEMVNGISQNDPLQVLFEINYTNGTMEFANSALMTNPPDKYLAFGRVKLPLRKTNFKDKKDLLKKLETNFKKVMDELKKQYDTGNMTVHDGKPSGVAIKNRLGK